jgi:hypothetical protein
MEARVQRALRQRMFLISYEEPHRYRVAGLTSAYTVSLHPDLAPIYECSCPDHRQRKQICKHIFFVLFRVLNQDPATWRPSQVLTRYEPSLSAPTEATASHNTSQTIEAIQKDTTPALLDLESKEWKGLVHEEEDCCICYESLRPEHGYTVVNLCHTCQHLFHADCYTTWKRFSAHQSCPLCRGPLPTRPKTGHLQAATKETTP